jgi:RNA polymerase sigma-70 factor (ECF subfamily)
MVAPISHRSYTARPPAVPRGAREPIGGVRCTRGAEDHLVERAAQGDVGAFEALVTRHQRAAVRLAAVIAGSADAEDIAQEAFVKAYRALDRFHHGAAFSPWLFRIVANEARNHRRSSGRRARLALRVLPTPAHGPTPEDAAVASQQREALMAALEGLPERDRLVLACRFLLGLSEAETAAALDCATGTVKSRTSRALDRLRERLEPVEVAIDG